MTETRYNKTIKKDNKKKTVAIIALIIASIVIAIILFATFSKPIKYTAKEKPLTGKPKAAKPKKIKSPYTGIELEEKIYTRRPLAVIIENHPNARPQSGLSKADWVFETVAEGGITRMLAFFHSENAESIGPIRSAREYFVSIAKSIDAVLVHVGGSPGGYKAIDDLMVTSVDEIKEGKPFRRIKERRAPHNLYSSTEELRNYIQEKGYDSLPVKTGYDFISDKPNPDPEIDEIEINYSSPPFKTVFKYDKTTGMHQRFLAGKQDSDLRAGSNISVHNVVVIVADISYQNDEKGRMDIQTEGTGDVFFFKKGILTKGKWIRPDFSSLYNFADEEGSPIKFSKGKTWFSIVSSDQNIKYETLKKSENRESSE